MRGENYRDGTKQKGDEGIEKRKRMSVNKKKKRNENVVQCVNNSS